VGFFPIVTNFLGRITYEHGDGWPLVRLFTSFVACITQILADPAMKLTWPVVRQFAIGAARGIYYLHSFNPPITHRSACASKRKRVPSEVLKSLTLFVLHSL